MPTTPCYRVERHEGQCRAATIQLNHPAYFWEAVVVKFDSFSWTQVITDKSKGINLAIMLTALCFFRYLIVYILKVPRFHFISHSDIHSHKANLTSSIVWKLCYFRNQYTTGNTFLCISIEKVGVSRERLRERGREHIMYGSINSCSPWALFNIATAFPTTKPTTEFSCIFTDLQKAG